MDLDSHPSLESPAPFQRCVSCLQSLKNLPVACGAVLCEEEVMAGESSGGAKASLRLWGASPAALRSADALKKSSSEPGPSPPQLCAVGQVAAVASLSFLGNLLVTSSCVPRSLYPHPGPLGFF